MTIQLTSVFRRLWQFPNIYHNLWVWTGFHHHHQPLKPVFPDNAGLGYHLYIKLKDNYHHYILLFNSHAWLWSVTNEPRASHPQIISGYINQLGQGRDGPLVHYAFGGPPAMKYLRIAVFQEMHNLCGQRDNQYTHTLNIAGLFGILRCECVRNILNIMGQ